MDAWRGVDLTTLDPVTALSLTTSDWGFQAFPSNLVFSTDYTDTSDGTGIFVGGIGASRAGPLHSSIGGLIYSLTTLVVLFALMPRMLNWLRTAGAPRPPAPPPPAPRTGPPYAHDTAWQQHEFETRIQEFDYQPPPGQREPVMMAPSPAAAWREAAVGDGDSESVLSDARSGAAPLPNGSGPAAMGPPPGFNHPASLVPRSESSTYNGPGPGSPAPPTLATHPSVRHMPIVSYSDRGASPPQLQQPGPGISSQYQPERHPPGQWGPHAPFHPQQQQQQWPPYAPRFPPQPNHQHQQAPQPQPGAHQPQQQQQSHQPHQPPPAGAGAGQYPPPPPDARGQSQETPRPGKHMWPSRPTMEFTAAQIRAMTRLLREFYRLQILISSEDNLMHDDDRQARDEHRRQAKALREEIQNTVGLWKNRVVWNQDERDQVEYCFQLVRQMDRFEPVAGPAARR